MRVACVLVAALVAACGGGGSGDDGDDGGPDAPRADAVATGDVLADDYPGDVGLGGDPAVIWFEDFEAASVGDVAMRYDQSQGQGRMQLVSDRPAGQGGTQAMAMTAGDGVSAVDLYKQLANGDEWWVRWYVKYEGGGRPWHHSGMWFGGYNPPMAFPQPMAGISPAGDDRFSLAIEPVFGNAGAERFDFYAYWMRMHSYMPEPFPPNDGTAYYGNSMIHQDGFTLDEDSWVCLEVHVRLNTDPASGAGAVLDVWKNDVPVAHFDEAGPMGYWVRDKFCPETADGTECTDYQMPATEILDLQLRATTALTLNAFWPQNYISNSDGPGTGALAFDQMVVATTRVGCIR
jgi:hypothetical protein